MTKARKIVLSGKTDNMKKFIEAFNSSPLGWIEGTFSSSYSFRGIRRAKKDASLDNWRKDLETNLIFAFCFEKELVGVLQAPGNEDFFYNFADDCSSAELGTISFDLKKKHLEIHTRDFDIYLYYHDIKDENCFSGTFRVQIPSIYDYEDFLRDKIGELKDNPLVDVVLHEPILD